MLTGLWNTELTPHGHWLKWGCWMALAAYAAGAIVWWPFPWMDWSERMAYLLLVPATAVLALSHLTFRRGGFLAALALGIVALMLAGETPLTRQDVKGVRQTAVMMWVLTAALAVYHDAGWQSDRRSWSCWAALALLYVGARSSDRLSWEVWSDSMRSLAIVPSVVILIAAGLTRDFRRILAPVAMACFYGRLFTVEAVLDLPSLEKSTVVLWLLTVALAVSHDAARLPSGRSSGNPERPST